MKRKIMISVILILVLAFVLTGCIGRKITEKVAENIVEKIAEEGSGNDIDVDIDKDGISISGKDGKLDISGGENLSWPKDAPKDIPEFNGDIFSSVVTGKSFMVGANDVKLDEFGAYVGMVESAGFESGQSVESNGVYLKQYTKDSIKLTLSYAEEAKSISITAEWE